jgi:hypothetical protein
MNIINKTCLFTIILYFCAGLSSANNQKGDDNTKRLSCDELLKKYYRYISEKKTTEAEKIIKEIETKDCGESDKKVAELVYHNRSTQKKTIKAKALTLSDEKITIGYQGSEHVVTVSGEGSWKAETECEWCSFRKETNRIIIQCEENPSMRKRIGNIVVTSGKRSKTITVINEGAPEMLRSSVSNLSFPAGGDQNTVDVYSNTNWSVDSVPRWITLKKNGQQLLFSAEPNKQHVQRTGNVVISTPSSATVIINVYQGAGDEEISFSKNNLNFGPDGGDEYIKVMTNADVWKLDYPHWCQVTRIGEDSIKIHCTPNDPIDMRREASVNVKTDFQTLGINIFQEPKPFQYMVPSMGIGGKALSLGVSAGYVMPMISTSSDGDFTGSVVNYSLGNNNEQVSYKANGGLTFGLFADIRIYKNIYLIAGLNYLQYSYTNKFEGDVYRQIFQTERYYQAGNTQNRYEEEYKLSQLEVPILGSYRLPVTKMSHVQINLGPVVNYGIKAKMNINGYTSSKDTYYYVIENGKLTNNLYDKRIQEIDDKGKGSFNLYKKEVDYWVIDKDKNESNKFNKLSDSPMKKLNLGFRLGIVYEYHGFDIGAEFTYMLTNTGNNKYWNANRWEIFDQHANTLLSGYQQRNHYLGIKLGYTFRY